MDFSKSLICYNLSAVRFVYRYVIELKARLQIISPKLPKSAQRWQKIHCKFWVNLDLKCAFGVADRRQLPIKFKTPSLNCTVLFTLSPKQQRPNQNHPTLHPNRERLSLGTNPYTLNKKTLDLKPETYPVIIHPYP